MTTSQVSARTVGSESTVSPAEASCWRRWDRFTVSPTSVYSSRSSEPSKAAAASPVESPSPRPNGGRPSARPALVDLGLAGVHCHSSGNGTVGMVNLGNRRTEDSHDSVAHELHHGPALAQDGLVHRRSVGVELAGQLARVGVLGDGRVGTDVAHHYCHLDSLCLADAPTLRAELLRQPSWQQARERLALLLTVDDGLVQEAQALQRPLIAGAHSLGQLQEDSFNRGVHRLGRRARVRRRSP